MGCYIGNAFSLNMLANLEGAEVEFKGIEIDEVPARDCESIVGHSSTASLFSALLGVEVAENRATYTLAAYDLLYVGQYSGPRLPEGATSLPEGASLKWYQVRIVRTIETSEEEHCPHCGASGPIGSVFDGYDCINGCGSPMI